MIYRGCEYTSDRSDLKVAVVKVMYRGLEYCKAKCILSNKRNGIYYETKNYKLYYKNIKHWRKVC